MDADDRRPCPAAPSCNRTSECGRVVCLLRRRITAGPSDQCPPPYDEDANRWPSLDPSE